ncbi:MAG: 2,3-diphosphoglycerate-dependent phosphoglycerate mutase [Verrucomicrobium sp.]|nr:2,3-diphosphoglycerate-dependent phosphoglycerate mutase [Verrucomicrobium sp.]
MPQLVLIRHGESTWNKENRFTGWTDVDLTEKGLEEARQAGRILHREGFSFDLAFSSVLKRGIHTLWEVLDKMDQVWIPAVYDWRLNERHYGALTGLNKAETAERHGAEQVHRWRRGYADRPPALSPDDPRASYTDPRYRDVPRERIPLTESLEDTVARVLPCWEERIAPALREGKRVVIAGHNNSMRALIKHLDHVSDQDISALELPNGVPLVYELNERLESQGRRYLRE